MLPVGSWRSTNRCARRGRRRGRCGRCRPRRSPCRAPWCCRAATACASARAPCSVAMVLGTACDGRLARRSMTPAAVCQSRSITRGSPTPGGSRSAFFNSTSMRGPMPARLFAAAKRGVSCSAAGCRSGQTPCTDVPVAEEPMHGSDPTVCAKGSDPLPASLAALLGLYEALEPAKVAARLCRQAPEPGYESRTS